jgi:hypothetical protein
MTYDGIEFPQGHDLPNSPPDVWGKKFLPRYADTGLALKCTVLPKDGVLCDKRDVASWFTARQLSTYSVPSSNWFTDNYTVKAEWSVTPSDPAQDSFLGFGSNVDCHGGSYCGVNINDGIRTVPNWLADFTSHTGEVTRVPDSPQTLWPALAVPAGTTSWGAPTRTGAALQAWIDRNIPTPS